MGSGKRDARNPNTRLPRGLSTSLGSAASFQGGGGGGGGGLLVVRKKRRREERKARRVGKKVRKIEWVERRRRRGREDGVGKVGKDGEGEVKRGRDEEGGGVDMKKKRMGGSGEGDVGGTKVRGNVDAKEKGGGKEVVMKEKGYIEDSRLEKLLGLRTEEGKQDKVVKKSYNRKITMGDPELMGLLQVAGGDVGDMGEEDSDSAPEEEMGVETYFREEDEKSDDDDDSNGGEKRNSFERKTEMDSEEEEGVSSEESLDGSDAEGENLGNGMSEGNADSAEENEDSAEEDEETESRALNDYSSTKPVKHIPPSRRHSGQENIAVRRRFRGLLNRLTDSNASRIALDLTATFQAPPSGCTRQHLSEIYATTVLDSVRDGTGAANVNPYIPAHAAIIAYIASTVSVSISACALVVLVRRIQSELVKLAHEPTCRHGYGYVALLGELYIRKVIHCSVIYELVRSLAQRFLESDVELLLLLIRAVGVQIRADDPLALKDIILLIQEKATSAMEKKSLGNQESEGFSVRVQVMLDLIYDVKNNKLKSTKNETLAKFDWALVPPVALKASFEELLDPNFTETMWWDGASSSRRRDGEELRRNATVASGSSPADLASLAVSQRLNTDYRRALFTAIMSSADVTDAFYRLVSLGALNSKKGHDRDAARIILHCCRAENVYNPFYGRLAKEFCKKSATLAYSFQYALWDVFKVVDGSESAKPMATRRVVNCANLLGYLLGCQALRLAVLKGGDIDASCGPRKSLLFRRALEICLRAKNGMKGFEVLSSEKWSGVLDFRSTLALFMRKELTADDIVDKARTAIDMIEGANLQL